MILLVICCAIDKRTSYSLPTGCDDSICSTILLVICYAVDKRTSYSLPTGCYGKKMSQDEAILINKEIKTITLAIIELRLSSCK